MNLYRICVYGIVQGVGFRPYIARLAGSIGVKGTVANKGSYVDIFICCNEEKKDEFLLRLKKEAPERSAILKVSVKTPESNLTANVFEDFQIIESEHEEGDIFVSPDIATCPKCKRELYDRTNRRYMHPFINCTACGPRVTILDGMPYDRERTSMKEFPMCPQCEYEYTHASTRRYDAQPVCCNDCGPEVYIPGTTIRGIHAITEARKAIRDGKIVAVKGIGGFHLCCNASDETAVTRLRTLKNRPMKPFAVMMKDLETIRTECELPEDEKILQIIDGPQKPILLLKRKEKSKLAASIAPDNPRVGVMLPYAPVQMLLFDCDDGFDIGTDMLVMTSGNISGAPICRTDDDAFSEISDFCDLILSHNRMIRLRADDSVMDLYKGEPYMIRRSRGYAPLPIMTESDYEGAVLGIGGELKNTFCIAKNQLFYPSPYVGDMADIRTLRALDESVGRMEELLEAKPELVVCDLHPRYNTTMAAKDQGLPIERVQHHYAHILSCMMENDVTEKVIGLSLDGTGYGTDGTIWGGEILLADFEGFTRKGHIYPFRHVGGDLASKEGWRIAASMLCDYFDDMAEEAAEKLDLCKASDLVLIRKLGERGINTVKSTSCGRLFDAVSAVLGIRKASTFEGEASMSLQFAAQRYVDRVSCDIASKAAALWYEENFTASIVKFESEVSDQMSLKTGWNDDLNVLPTNILFKSLAEEKLIGEDTEKLAFFFHYCLGKLLSEAVLNIKDETGITKAALSGGVFQNTMLLEIVEDSLQDNSMTVYRHHLIPPNDGGICLGQAGYGMAKINRKEETVCVLD